MRTYYLLDVENISPQKILSPTMFEPLDVLYVFMGNKHSHINFIEELKDNGVIVIYIKDDPKAKFNGADCYIMTYTGYVLSDKDDENQDDYSVCILSNDKIFDNVVSFWQHRGYNVFRAGSMSEYFSMNKAKIYQENGNV